MTVQILVSSNPDNLEAAIKNRPSATVEAEYGSRVVEGTLLTLAHHAPAWAHFKSPCTRESIPVPHLEVIGLSHVDLDSVGGALSLMGKKPENFGFWQLVGFVDVNGPHKLSKSQASEADIERLYAYWAWAENQKVYPPRDGSVMDVTAEVERHGHALQAILVGDEAMREAGQAFKKKGMLRNRHSFVQMEGPVIVRISPDFTNDLYETPDGVEGLGVVAFNPTTGSVTMSLANPIEGVSCRALVEKLWGPLAGGHMGIAGSPRDQRMQLTDVLDAAHTLRGAIRRITPPV